MVSLYVGLRFPEVIHNKYERFAVNNVLLSSNCVSLKMEIAKKVKISTENIQLIYCGRPISDGQSLESQGVKPGVTIHAMHRAALKIDRSAEVNEERPNLTPEQKRRIVMQFQTLQNSHFHRISRPEILQEILQEYPAFHSNLGALSFLRDPVLLSSMQDPDNLEKISENYSILLEAAPFIAKVLKKKEEKTKSTDAQPELFAGDDQLSDSSSSSDSLLPSPSTSNNPRRITRQQLVSALAMASNSNSSRNSLSNIAQRNLDQNAAAEASEQNPAPGPSSNSGSYRMISTSMLNDVLSRISSGATTSQPSATASTEPAQAVPAPAQQYTAELQRMREMGLLDDQVNLQALQLCNGDVEAAINLVFSDEL
ncbi:hypothetical protein DMENIID0001_101350 [Sergentomyia squamirostris]